VPVTDTVEHVGNRVWPLLDGVHRFDHPLDLMQWCVHHVVAAQCVFELLHVLSLQ